MTIDIETVATDQDLANEAGGQAALLNLIPTDWNGSAVTARQDTLDEVLAHLVRQTPPIHESYLSDVTELNRAVVYGSMANLLLKAITGGPDDPHAVKHKIYSNMYKNELASLSPTLISGERGEPDAVAVFRR